MKLLKKFVLFALILSLPISCDFCEVHCAFAWADHHHSESVPEVSDHCHDSAESHHGPASDKHNTDALCCSNLVAVTSSSNNNFTGQILKNRVVNHLISTEPKLVLPSVAYVQYEIEFPPGVSPPVTFLYSYTTHAPPVIS